MSEEAYNAIDNRERELQAELSAQKQNYETELKVLEDSISQALKQAKESSERELSNQKYALRSEKQKLLDEAKKEEKKWQEFVNEMKTINGVGCLVAFFSVIAAFLIGVATYIAGGKETYYPAAILTILVIYFGVYGFSKVMEVSAKERQKQIEREYDDRIAALEREWSEELSRKRQQIMRQAEEERQALTERFERQRAELERLMDQEVVQKRQSLAQLFQNLNSPTSP